MVWLPEVGFVFGLASASIARRASLLGFACPFSHRLTVENVTATACANSSWVSPSRLRRSRISAPVTSPSCIVSPLFSSLASPPVPAAALRARSRSAVAGPGIVPPFGPPVGLCNGGAIAKPSSGAGPAAARASEMYPALLLRRSEHGEDAPAAGGSRSGAPSRHADRAPGAGALASGQSSATVA